MNTKLKAGIPLVLVAFIFLSVLVSPAAAVNTGLISPSSTTCILSTPVPFHVTGFNATNTYTIWIDGVTTTQTFVAGSDGSASFTYTFTTVGSHVLQVKQSNPTMPTYVVTANVVVSDLVSDMMPWIILALTFIVLFSVIGMVKGLFRKF